MTDDAKVVIPESVERALSLLAFACFPNTDSDKVWDYPIVMDVRRAVAAALRIAMLRGAADEQEQFYNVSKNDRQKRIAWLRAQADALEAGND